MSKSVVALDKRTLIVGQDGNGRKIEYEPSRRELLLEGICRSFGTELLGANAHGPLDDPVLTRMSRPVILTHQKNGRRFLLQMQYSRFCILRIDQQKLLEAARLTNQSVTWEKLLKTYKKRVDSYAGTSEYRIMAALFDQQILRSLGLTVGRFPKEIYAAIYALPQEGIYRTDPDTAIYIHEADRQPTHCGLNWPAVYITATRQPFFFRSQAALDQRMYDSIRVSAPEAAHRINEALALARKLNPLDPESVNFSHITLVNQNVNSEQTMAHIRALIAAYTLGSAI